ncbi:DUF2273 domain-containing protein [Rathayibacter iranicus]|uniref:DUF2273 domain-containing protein n=2 Tax=Rathayibacter iranicus TaxID=59737 RepID=A0AAD1ADJ0_9MICO|nr:DUF2273 domain-containing protein [Rathayibacter iranicus]AZZ56134.1 DUF2273 domain-containing protein [Rathayibacter iranicus]MWV30170.1 DUF2273 domain-containing protein [Rathayibacter iranicus NCPPB 2253 = VKM Ac-1602]PPI46202.1 hypothetical protein C5E09_08750 [Rathayibacter iranicus]PPI59576.1 hypothetical protein C5E08_09670 [Rathayibacter iranicus]PPI71054.1 hypothetical protein C5E01_08715 [Rathayibacter iranicus]
MSGFGDSSRPTAPGGRSTVLGVAIGAILAFAALLFGFWGFVLTAVFMALGVAIARVADGSLDVRSLVDVFRGRTTSR